MSEATGPSIRAVSWVDGHGREQILVRKSELDAANERIRELTIDRDEAERERVKAVELERSTAAVNERVCKMVGDREEAIDRLRQERDDARADADRAYAYGYRSRKDLEAESSFSSLLSRIATIAEHNRNYMAETTDEIVLKPTPLPRPEATDPAHLRFAATIIEQTAVPKDHGGDGEDQGRTARQLRDEADRIEGKRPSPDEQLIAGVADICESTVRNLVTALGVTHVSNVDPSVVDWRSTAEEALSAAGLLSGGDA